MVAFLAVMLTIQCTILIRLIEFDAIIASFEMNVSSIEFVIKPKEKKGIVDKLDDFFRFLS